WPTGLVYWNLPLLKVTPALPRWGALCEQKYNLVEPAIAASSPTIALRWWEKALLPKLSLTHHPHQHLSRGIPHPDLSRVLAIFSREGLLDPARVFTGYGQYLRFLLRPAVGDRAPAA